LKTQKTLWSHSSNILLAPTQRNDCVVPEYGNKLTIAFEKAGEKKVVDSFVERV
jgi:hypothetical protein